MVLEKQRLIVLVDLSIHAGDTLLEIAHNVIASLVVLGHCPIVIGPIH